MKTSVAMAYYNGIDYIKEQLDSIMEQLGDDDEVVISVDGADDGSDALLRRWASEDRRLRIVNGPGKGVVRNFEHALRHCGGDVIFLADQDDIWLEGRVDKVKKCFEDVQVMAVLHDAILVDEHGRKMGEDTLFTLRRSRTGIAKNLLRNSYVGCCMAFRRGLLPVILPIPERMYMHDYWMGTAAEMSGRCVLLEEPLIAYRRHGGNVTQMQHGGLGFMIKKRWDMLHCLRILRRRIRQNRGGQHE